MAASEIRQRSLRNKDDQVQEDNTSQRGSTADTESTIDIDDAFNMDDEVETPEPSRTRPLRKRRAAEIKARDNANSLITAIIFIALSLLFVKYMDSRLPGPVFGNSSSTFVEERARNDLHDLIEVKVRVSGSPETDVITVEKLLEKLRKIEQDQSDVHEISSEAQYPTGQFYLDGEDDNLSTYAKISNVVAKLEPLNSSSNSSILLNCHFDTKAGSPGATDNMISCATMLEILRVLSRRKNALRNTIVFLFNGAEEYGLQGAHGFVAGMVNDTDEIGHPWSKNLKTFINLEGAGAGGREILFQSGPGNGWVLKAYSGAAPRPYGLVIAEEAFQRGLIPSDTDYRIFRDFSDIPGVDMAFIKNGWVYHTKWDKLSEIPAGSIQHMGDNALALTEYLGNLDFGEIEESGTKMIFFDVFGWFMIYYTEVVGIIVNAWISVVAIGLVCLEIFVLDGAVLTTRRLQRLPKDKPIIEKLICLIWLPVSTLLAWGTGILMAYIVALLFNWTGYYKPFYSYPTLSFVLFGVPAILVQAIVYAFAHKGSENQVWLAGKATIAILTLALTFVTRVTYVFMIILVFGFVGRYAARYAVKLSPIPNKSIQKLLIYLFIGELIPFTLTCYLTLTLADVFVPILGRSGTETNANVFFGLIVAGILSIIAFNGLVSVLVVFSKPILIVCLCLSVFLINPLVVFGFVGKVPFQEKTPLRLQLVEVDRIWYQPHKFNERQTVARNDSGYWFWAVDPNTMDAISIIAKTVPELEDAYELDANVEFCADLYCAQPFIWPTTNAIKKTPWVPKTRMLPESVRETVQMKILEDIPIPGRVGRRITFSFSGPTQLTIILSPGPNYELTNWSFGESLVSPPVQHNGLRWLGRSTYFIYHGRGHGAEDFVVTCDFEGQNSRSPVVDLLVTGSFLYGEQMMGPEFTDLAERFPSWTNVMGWTAVMKIFPIY